MNFKEIQNKLKGPVFPVITPFDKNENLDLGKLRDYLDFLYDNGARLFYAMAYSTRYSLLTHDEIKDLNATVCDCIKSKGNDDCVVIVGDPLHVPTITSIDFAKHAYDHGADIMSAIFMERYHCDKQVYDHFEKVANGCPDLGILIHEQKMNSAWSGDRVLYPINLIDKLASIDNVIALKEDAKQHDYSVEVINTVKDRLSIICSGNAKKQFTELEPYGCEAYLVGVGNFLPALSIKFYELYKTGKYSEYMSIIDNIEQPFIKLAKSFGWHLGLKSAIAEYGLMERTERSPLQMLPQDQHDKIVECLEKIKLYE